MHYNSDEFEEIINIFSSESEEIIQELNDNFLLLEKNIEDKTPLKKLLQLSHSLKGSARMLGFNGIQNIAHKLEDILSFWKQENVQINNDMLQIIYETCDYLAVLVKKCVELKSDYYDEKSNELILELDKILKSGGEAKIEEKKPANGIDYIKSKNIDINAVVLELMFVIERDDEEIIPVIAENLEQLDEIFSQTEFTNIKEKIRILFDKLAEDIPAKEQIEFVKKNIPILRNDIYNLFKALNIKSSVSQSKQTVETPQKKEEKAEEKPQNQEQNGYDIILSNLQKIKYDISYADEVVNFLKTVETVSKEEAAVLNKTIKVLNLFRSKNMQVNNDCYIVILQCIYMFKRISSNEEMPASNNIEFLLQRLSVVEDMFNLMNANKPSSVQVQEKKPIAAEEISDLNKNISGFDLQEIKTLRVDTAKLDNLISQTGELLINGIKTKNHLLELSEINSEFVKWSGDSKKILNYLKYLEKKGFFTQNADDSITAFCKKLQNFCIENSVIIGDVNSRLDNLYNMMFTDNNKLYQNAVEIDVIAKGIRVLPLATIFHSFPRMMRDIAKENKKQIDFIITGSDTTVDKKLMEEIKMPLIHLLRNAVSHGIEVPEERIKKQKNPTGTIKLSAKQVENYVLISIEDDGFGIDAERVKEISVQKGLLTREEVNNLDDEQIVKLLFLPGFSTSESVDEISGRGVGLDVVKTKITNLNGDIFIDSEINKGCKVTIKIPLTMSTIKTFIMLADGQKYALPVDTIKYVKTIKNSEIYKKDNTECIMYNSHSVPIFSLAEILGGNRHERKEDDVLTVVIIEIKGQEAAFEVDKLIGDQEILRKKLVPPIIKIKNISGFATLSSGEICLVINPYELMENNLVRDYINDVVTKLISVDKKE